MNYLMHTLMAAVDAIVVILLVSLIGIERPAVLLILFFVLSPLLLNHTLLWHLSAHGPQSLLLLTHLAYSICLGAVVMFPTTLFEGPISAGLALIFMPIMTAPFLSAIWITILVWDGGGECSEERISESGERISEHGPIIASRYNNPDEEDEVEKPGMPDRDRI